MLGRIQYRRLYLWVDSPLWVHQLTLLKPKLLQKINDSLKNPLFKDIILRCGRPPMALPDTPHTEKKVDRKPLASPENLSPELDLCIQEYLKSLGDPGLKEVLRRVMIKSFSARLP